MAAILDLVQPVVHIRSADPENPTVEQTGSGSDDPLQRYGHSKISKVPAGRYLGFALISANPENPNLEPNSK